MYNLFPVKKEVGDSPEDDRRPPCPTSHHHLNLSDKPPSRQQNHQANPIPHYHPPYCAAGNPAPPPLLPAGPIYYSMSPLPIYPQRGFAVVPPPYPQPRFAVVPPPYPQHGFAVVPPPTGPSHVGFKDENLPNLTDRELQEIYDKFIADRRQAIKEQGKKRRDRRSQIRKNKMVEVHSS